MDSGLELDGRTVLITRAKHQADSLRQEFESVGARVVEFSSIEIVDPVSWKPADNALRSLTDFDWVIFASANAVTYFFNRLNKLSTASDKGFDTTGATIPKSLKVAAIGSATQECLSKFGCKTDFVPSSFIAETLLAEFPNLTNIAGKRFLWPRTNAGRELIKSELRRAGASVEVIEFYRTLAPEDTAESRQALKQLFDTNTNTNTNTNTSMKTNRIDAIALTSSESAKNFAEMLARAFELGEANTLTTLFATTFEHIKLIAIGKETAKSVAGHFGRVDATAIEQTKSGLVAATIECLSKKISL